uniref:PH domain-containing protein n=1 Tax=Amphimedon queenslandica TaxID=400682 RepID=A0A1X7TXY0_AMPQE
MAGVIKKGYLDVKMKGMISSTYKRRYVILRRNTDKGSKAVEITETETLDQNDIDIIPLNDAWTVQEKASQNKKRYAFELVVGGNVMMTFSCPSLANREEWTESFHILNKVSAYSPPLNAPDMYSVVLERSLSAVEIGVSGPCLLRLQDSAIVLYSECGRNKLHNWAAENVKNLSLGVEQLLLEVYRPGNKALTEFIFNVEMNVGRQILTSWSMSLLENVDPRKLNLISNYILSTQGNGGGKEASKSNSLSKNFFGTLKQKGSQTNIKDEKGTKWNVIIIEIN